MITITPQEEGAQILAHYLRTLARAAGLRWTEANDSDIQKACALLGSDAATAALPLIPPYGADQTPERPTRPTLQLKRDPRNATSEENRQAADDLRLMNAANMASSYRTVKTTRGDE